MWWRKSYFCDGDGCHYYKSIDIGAYLENVDHNEQALLNHLPDDLKQFLAKCEVVHLEPSLSSNFDKKAPSRTRSLQDDTFFPEISH